MFYREHNISLCIMVVQVVDVFAEVTKLESFLSQNQRTQRKSLNFENWCSEEVSKSAKI